MFTPGGYEDVIAETSEDEITIVNIMIVSIQTDAKSIDDLSSKWQNSI